MRDALLLKEAEGKARRHPHPLLPFALPARRRPANRVGVYARGFLRARRRLEVWLLLEAVQLRADDGREGAARRVVVLHGRVVVLARDVDAVLGPRQLVLHALPEFARLQLRPRLLQREKPADGPAETVRRVYDGLLLLGRLVAALALRRRARGVYETLVRVRYLPQDLLLLHARRLRGGDDVGYQIGAAL